MRKLVGLLVLASGTAGSLFACSSTDTTSPPVVDGGDGDSSTLDAGQNDADASCESCDAGDEDFVVPDASVVCETTPCVTSIVGSGDAYCALLDDGHVACWGANDFGQLGRDPEGNLDITTPALVEGLADVAEIGMSTDNTCARTKDGSVYCWGEAALVHMGAEPDAGEPPFGAAPTPTRQEAVPRAETLGVGTGFACVTVAGGQLSCWGTNERRELGRGPTEQSMVSPGAATLLESSVIAPIGGYGRTFVIAADGKVLSWGANTAFGRDNYLLGRDSSEDPNERPTVVPSLSRVRGLSTNFFHSCAVAGRFVECWGSNSGGQLGRGTFEDIPHLPARSILADVTDDDDADASITGHDVPVQVVTGRRHSCAVLGSGRVYCWGDAGSGRVLGAEVKTYAVRGTPTRIDGLSGPAVRLAASTGGTCALTRAGAVDCWGTNDRGQLGIGSIDTGPHPTPVRLSFPSPSPR